MNDDAEFRRLLSQHYNGLLKGTETDGCAHQDALKRKSAAIRAGDSPAAEELAAVEYRLCRLEKRIEQIREARKTGEAIQASLAAIADSLNEARKIHTSASLLSPMASFRKSMRQWTDYVQSCAQGLQDQLLCFGEELADLDLPFSAEAVDYTPPRCRIHFRLGFILVSRTMDFLNDSIRCTQKTGLDVKAAMHQLESLESSAQEERTMLRARWQALVEQFCIFETGD